MTNHQGNRTGGTAAGANSAAVNETAAEKDRILTIDTVAKMFRTSTLTLRLLELRGVVRRRCVDGNLVFNWSDCERISLLVTARKAGFADGDVAAVLNAMTDEESPSVIDAGRMKCLSLIRLIEGRQTVLGAALAELYRIDWELSNRRSARRCDDRPAFV